MHMTRDPFHLFPSTRRLWQSLDAIQGCQLNKDVGLNEYVFDALSRMYEGLESQRSAVPGENVVDIRYEDLVVDPITVLEEVYKRLNLGDFAEVKEKLTAYVESLKDYQTNRHSKLELQLEAEICRRWAPYLQRYGYECRDES